MMLYYITVSATREESGRERFHVKSREMPEREKKKQREKWRAASSAYKERKKMANAVLDLPPPSMEIIPAVLVDVDEAQEQPENPGQAVVDPIPLNEDFNSPVSSTPEIREGIHLQHRNVAKKCRKRSVN